MLNAHPGGTACIAPEPWHPGSELRRHRGDVGFGTARRGQGLLRPLGWIRGIAKSG